MRSLTLLVLTLVLIGTGCSKQPDRTPTAPPVESDDTATNPEASIPTAPAPRRIETH